MRRLSLSMRDRFAPTAVLDYVLSKASGRKAMGLIGLYVSQVAHFADSPQLLDRDDDLHLSYGSVSPTGYQVSGVLEQQGAV